MNEFNIYFSDLTKDAQQRLLAYAGIADPREANWDMDVLPIASIMIEQEAE